MSEPVLQEGSSQRLRQHPAERANGLRQRHGQEDRGGKAGLRQARMRRQRHRGLHLSAHGEKEGGLYATGGGLKMHRMDAARMLLPGAGRRDQMTVRTPSTRRR